MLNANIAKLDKIIMVSEEQLNQLFEAYRHTRLSRITKDVLGWLFPSAKPYLDTAADYLMTDITDIFHRRLTPETKYALAASRIKSFLQSHCTDSDFAKYLLNNIDTLIMDSDALQIEFGQNREGRESFSPR